MSGGHFEYLQHKIEDAADEIKRLAANNDSDKLDEFGDPEGLHFPLDVIEKFQEASNRLRLAGEILHQIDYLICGDSSIESFRYAWDRINRR